MFSEEIMTCLEQKELLLTQILNLTKQIEVRCSEPEISLEHFLDQRGSLMQRVDKCNNLIESQVAQMLPEQQNRANLILNLKIDEADCGEQERAAFELAKKCSSLLQRAPDLDKSANDLIKHQYEDVKKKIKQTRKPVKGQSMFLNPR